MTAPYAFAEHHFMHRTGWLRAAVLGANDGIVSTASLIAGVAAAHAGRGNILIAATAGLVAGAMSMAAGEFVSVSSQADTEKADLARERQELDAHAGVEHEELARIYVERGLDYELAKQVATQLTAHDALGAHARDELGIYTIRAARPAQAAIASAVSFAMGGALPLTLALCVPVEGLIRAVSLGSIVFLAVLGAVSARLGGAKILTSIIRVTFWGAFAMAATTAVGSLFSVRAP